MPLYRAPFFFGNIVNQRASKALNEHETTPGVEAVTRGTIAFDDAALVERFRKGDMQAFGSLVAKYQDRIYNLILRMCPRTADAEELAQEAFLKAMERIGQFRGQSRFYTWLFRIAANLTISHRRRGGRLRFQSLTGPEEFDGSQADGLTAALAEQRNPGPMASAMSAESARRVDQALAEIDDEFRVVVVLRDIEEMDYGEIADVLDLPIGTVKSRLHRARCMLRAKLADLIA